MSIQNLGGLPSAPGDTVRDRQTGEDYVIQTIGAAAVVGALSISLINLYDNTVHNLMYHSEHDWTQAYSVIKVNIDNDLPETVIKKVQTSLSDIFGNNQELLAKIKLPENQPLRDLLLLTSESSPELFKSNLVDLAETIVGTSGKIPSTSVVRNILEEAAQGTGRTTEFVDDLAQQIVQQARIKAGQQGLRQLSSNAADFLPYRELQLANKYKLASTRSSKVSADSQNIVDYIFGQNSNENLASLRDIPFFKKAFGLKEGEPAGALKYATKTNQQKISRIIRQIFNEDNQISTTLENYIDRAIRVGTNEQNNVQFNNILRFIVENLDTDTLYQIKNRMAKTAVTDAQNRSGVFQGMAGTYGRKTAIGRNYRDFSGLRGSFDFKAVANAIDGSDTTGMVSIDIPTFTEMLGDKPVVINGVKYRNIGQAIRKVRSAINKNPYVVMSNQDFKNMVISPNDFNLDNIVKATQELGVEAKGILDDFHFSFNGDTMVHSGFRMTMFNLDQVTQNIAQGEKVLKRGKQRVYVSTVQGGMGRVATLNPELLTSSNLSQYRTGDSNRIGNVGYIDLDPEIVKKHNLTNEALTAIDDIKTARDFENAGGLTNLVPENLRATALKDQIEMDTYTGAKAAVHRLETPKAHISGIPRAVREQVLMEAREKGRRKAQAMVLNLRNDSGLTRVIGSDIRRGLDEQLEAVRRFMTRGGVLLDIETQGGYLDSSPTRLTQIAMRDVNVSQVRKGLGSLTSSELRNASKLNPVMEKLAPLIYHAEKVGFGASEQANHIIDLATHLGNAIRTNTPILTQTGYDLRTMIEIGERLVNNGEGGDELIKALDILRDVQANHLADFTLVSQLAGHQLGSLNQAALQVLYGLPEEEHLAASDTAHGAALSGLMSKDVLKALRKGGRTLEEWKRIVTSPNAQIRNRYFFNNTRSTEAGSVKDLVGLYDVSTAEEDLVTAVFETVTPSKEGWIKTGKYHSVTTGVNQLGGMLHKFAQQLDPNEGPTEELMLEATRLGTSRRERMFRGLNFLTKSYWDEFGSYDAEALGPFGFNQLRVDKMALDLADRYEGKIAEYMMGKAENGDLIVPQSYSYKAAQILTKKHLRRLGIHDEDTYDRVATRFYDIMSNPVVKSDLTDSASLYANLLSGKSAFGNTLLNLMDENNEIGVLKAQLFYMHVKNKAIAQGQEGLLKNISYDPRISLRLTEQLENGGRLELSRGANDLVNASSTSKILSAQEALAGEAVLKLSEGKATGILNRFGLAEYMQESQMTMEQLQKLALAYKYDSGAIGDNQRYLQAMSRLVDVNSKVPGEAQYAPLKDLLDRMLAHEEFHRETIIGGLQRTIEKQVDPSGQGTELVQKAINELNERYTRIGQSTANNSRKIKMFNKATRSVLGRYLKNENFRNQITANYDQIDSTQLLARMDDLTPDGLTEVFGIGGVWETAYKANGGFGAETINQAITTSRLLAAKMYQEGKGEMEVHAALGDLYKEVETGKFDPANWNERIGVNANPLITQLHEQGLGTQGTGTQGTNVATQQQAVNAGTAGVGESSTGVRQTHEMMITEEFNADHLSKLRTPLFVAGGLLALMSLKGPSDNSFVQGNVSEKIRLNPVARYSEIPGQSDLQSTWSGQAEPFRLDISFSGFINDRRQQDKLVRSIYDSVSGSMQITRANTNIQDNRKNSHREKIREMID